MSRLSSVIELEEPYQCDIKGTQTPASLWTHSLITALVSHCVYYTPGTQRLIKVPQHSAASQELPKVLKFWELSSTCALQMLRPLLDVAYFGFHSFFLPLKWQWQISLPKWAGTVSFPTQTLPSFNLSCPQFATLVDTLWTREQRVQVVKKCMEDHGGWMTARQLKVLSSICS